MYDEIVNGDHLYNEKNYNAAFLCYQKAIENNNGADYAKLYLAYLYQYGEGIGNDIDKAIAYYQQVENSGNVDIIYKAKNQLGIIYYDDKKDIKKAIEYFAEAEYGEDAAKSNKKVLQKKIKRNKCKKNVKHVVIFIVIALLIIAVIWQYNITPEDTTPEGLTPEDTTIEDSIAKGPTPEDTTKTTTEDSLKTTPEESNTQRKYYETHTKIAEKMEEDGKTTEYWAEKGDYFEGKIKNGKIVYGKLYNSSGAPKDTIIIGE